LTWQFGLIQAATDIGQGDYVSAIVGLQSLIKVSPNIPKTLSQPTHRITSWLVNASPSAAAKLDAQFVHQIRQACCKQALSSISQLSGCHARQLLPKLLAAAHDNGSERAPYRGTLDLELQQLPMETALSAFAAVSGWNQADALLSADQ
jgi:hypothetical protein